jgi:hypothetical protein
VSQKRSAAPAEIREEGWMRLIAAFMRYISVVPLVVAADILFPAPAAALYITGCRSIETSRMTARYGDGHLMDVAGNAGPFGPFAWQVSYTQCFDGSAVKKDLAIDFVFDSALGFTELEESLYRSGAERAIESIWNDKFFVRDGVNDALFPVLLDISTAGAFDQTVHVFRTVDMPRVNMINWNDSLPHALMAHEVGHMLGLFDEYIGGAVDRYPNPTLSYDGLMGLGALWANPLMYERYYQQYADFMNALNPGIGPFLLQRVPEPGSLWLAAMALMLLRVGAACRGGLLAPAGAQQARTRIRVNRERRVAACTSSSSAATMLSM